VRPGMVNVGRRAVKTFSWHFSQQLFKKPLHTWHTAFTHGPIPWDSISGLSLIYFLLITDLVKFSTLMVNGRKFPFFSATIITASWYLVYSINTWSHIVGFDFRSVAHPLPVYRL
jgi:hypothetical protein